MAIACLGLVTLGPFLDPLCSLPSLYSFITFLTLPLALGVFFIPFLQCGHMEHFIINSFKLRIGLHCWTVRYRL